MQDDQKLHIDDAKPEDVQAMRAINRGAWLALYPSEEYGITLADIEAIDFFADLERRQKEIRDIKNAHTWVVRDDTGKVLGYCKATREKEYGEINAMYMVPELQGKGWGKKLMEKALDWLDPNMDIILHVVKYNTSAIGFYEKMGFHKEGDTDVYRGTLLPSGKQMPRIKMRKIAII